MSSVSLLKILLDATMPIADRNLPSPGTIYIPIKHKINEKEWTTVNGYILAIGP